MRLLIFFSKASLDFQGNPDGQGLAGVRKAWTKAIFLSHTDKEIKSGITGLRYPSSRPRRWKTDGKKP